VLVDDELVAAVEKVQQRDGAVRAVELVAVAEGDHRQPPPAGGQRIELAGGPLLRDEQLVAGLLPLLRGDDLWFLHTCRFCSDPLTFLVASPLTVA
jgi:hypothetical protein